MCIRDRLYTVKLVIISSKSKYYLRNNIWFYNVTVQKNNVLSRTLMSRVFKSTLTVIKKYRIKDDSNDCPEKLRLRFIRIGEIVYNDMAQ